MKRLTFLGDINAYTGYGLHGIEIVRGLERLADVHCSIRALSMDEHFTRLPDDIRAKLVTGLQPEPCELLLHPPNFCPTKGKKTAYFTMWETTKLPPFGVEFLNRAEVVIVPCGWNESTFSACGVTAPIRVVPLGINTDVFHYRVPGPREMNPATGKPWRATFGCAGRLAHGGVRKGINEVIELFQSAFADDPDVRLKVKCFTDCPIKPYGDDPRILIETRFMTEEELAGWYASLDCFVSLARGEGWGLMQHQAMAVGRPVISPLFGGVTEFMTRENALTLPYQLEPAEAAYTNCGHWAVTKPFDVWNMLTRAADDVDGLAMIGASCAMEVAGHTWEASNQALHNVLYEFDII